MSERHQTYGAVWSLEYTGLLPSPSEKREGGERKSEARLIYASWLQCYGQDPSLSKLMEISCSGASACYSAEFRIPRGCKFDGHHASSCLEMVFEGRLNHLLVLVGRTCMQARGVCPQKREKAAS